MRKMFFLLLLCFSFAPQTHAQTWTTKLDKSVRFYQTTDMGVVIVGTEKSIYAMDGATGDVIWRRKDAELDENDVAPVPGSDLLLLSFEKGERTRIEAVDIMTGNRIWRSDKIKGALMQMAVEPEANLLALVLAKDAKGHANDGLKRHALLHVLDLASGDELWKNELGEVEMILVGETLYVRTGGQFTRLKDGETIERGPYGVSAIDTRKGKVLWRYKGADKGITNLVLPNAETIMVADRDDLISIDTSNGKRRAHVRHGIERAAFGLLNEGGDVVIGGQNELAAFDPSSGRELWRARHTPPGRGILRTVAAIAARAASLYFRYGGVASTAFRGIQIARVATSISYSGLLARTSVSNLQALATGAARNYATRYAAARFRAFGMLARVRGNLATGSGLPSLPSIPSTPS